MYSLPALWKSFNESIKDHGICYFNYIGFYTREYKNSGRANIILILELTRFFSVSSLYQLTQFYNQSRTYTRRYPIYTNTYN